MLNKLSQNKTTQADFRKLFQQLEGLAQNIDIKIGDWGSLGTAITKYDPVRNKSSDIISKDTNCLDAIKKAITFLINGEQSTQTKTVSKSNGLNFSMPDVDEMVARQKENPLSFYINSKVAMTYNDWRLNINPAETQLAEERLSNAAKKLRDTDIVVMPSNENGAQVIEVANLYDGDTFGKRVNYLSREDNLLEALDKAAEKLEKRFQEPHPPRKRPFPSRNSLDING